MTKTTPPLYPAAAVGLVCRQLGYLLPKRVENVFGILNLDHWNLFVIWFLELGVLIVFIRSVNQLHSGLYRVKWHGPVIILSSGMILLMQFLEVFAGDVGINLRR